MLLALLQNNGKIQDNCDAKYIAGSIIFLSSNTVGSKTLISKLSFNRTFKSFES